MEQESTRSAALSALIIAARVLLVVSLVLLAQFLLGIVVNLFVKIPDSHPGAGASYVVGAWRSVGWALSSKWPYLALHVIVGLSLVVGSVTVLIRRLLARQFGWLLVWGSTGALGAVLAAVNGIYFLIHPDVDTASLLMAIGFATAIGSVIAQLFLVGLAGRGTPSQLPTG